MISSPTPSRFGVFAGAVGALSAPAYLAAIQGFQFNVATYAMEPSSERGTALPLIFAATLFLTMISLAAFSCRGLPLRRRVPTTLASLQPLALAAPIALWAFLARTPPFATGWWFVLCAAWTMHRMAAVRLTPSDARHEPALNDAVGTTARGGGPANSEAPRWDRADRWSIAALVAAIALLVVVHTRIQINFFEHFMLGHADIGHYAEELKNAAAGRGLRCDSFPNTRLGWHFVPLMYVLVPVYALWPTPALLMGAGATLVHLPALLVYFLARRLAGSSAIALSFAAAWLFLPSISRLIYANTYGFQWDYASLPCLMLAAAAVVARRWRWVVVASAATLLVQETTAAAVFGLGLVTALFTPRRRLGAAIAAVAFGYFLICVAVVIPHFAESGRYERSELFGSLGSSFTELAINAARQPSEVLSRLSRSEAVHFLAMLLVPMALFPIRGWRIALAAAPTLALVLLLENRQWLTIKFWYQSTLLPPLFVGVLASIRPLAPFDQATALVPPHEPTDIPAPTRPAPARQGSTARSVALAVLYAAAWSHYFFGFSPLAKPFEVYSASTHLREDDPRLAFVNAIRNQFPRDHTVLATERVAAHFTDYARLYTGKRVRPTDLVILDRGDTWDATGLPGKATEFEVDPHYQVHAEFGSLKVFTRRSDAPSVEREP